MGHMDAIACRLPEEAFRTRAFFWLWCVVELVAALRYRKPVVMLVGVAADEGGGFIPNLGILQNLYLLLSV